jgi:glycosyltransferase involved in cell wall biosynthesis
MIFWIASYPRSGNTFVRILLKHYYHIHTYSMYDDKRLADVVGHPPDSISLPEMIVSDKTYFVKIHDLPNDNFPAIYLVRDGRDALVSYAHYTMTYEQEGGIEFSQAAFHNILHDLIVYNESFGGWGPNVLAWTQRSAPTAILKFEDIVSFPDPISVVGKALEEIGYSGNSPLASDKPPSFEDLHNQMPDFFREGKIGGWKDEMPENLLELFWDMHGNAMELMEYSIDQQLLFYRFRAKQHLETIRALEGILLNKEKVSQPQQSDLEAKEAVIQAQQSELEAKEKVIQAYRGSYSFWIANGPNHRFRGLAAVIRRARNFQTIFQPKIGVLEQYSPRPLLIPDWYVTAPRAAVYQKLPSISIVTPSYNQGEFIERTIRSVLDQKYPQLQYIVQDGNSSDGTPDVLKSYEEKLAHFESRPDNGQAHAINLGFQHTSGEIMAYLNSDDVLLPGALAYVADYFCRHPGVDAVYSHRVIINEKDLEIGRWILPPHDNELILWADLVPQETLFWRRSLWDRIGGRMDESYQFALDWDLLIRFHAAGAKFACLPRFLAAFRMQPGQKTIVNMPTVGLGEMNRLRKQIHGREVGWEEVYENIHPYLRRSILYHKLYRLGILRY